MRPCFFVKIRNARGRKVAGARRTGRIEGFDGPVALAFGRIGCTGLSNACEDERSNSGCEIALLVFLNKGSAFEFSIVPQFDIGHVWNDGADGWIPPCSGNAYA